MKDSVLTLGERIVLAVRLAAIEHVRQELAEHQPERPGPVGDEPAGFTDESEPPRLHRPDVERWAYYLQAMVEREVAA